MKSEPNAFSRLPDDATRLCPACGLARITHQSDYPSRIAPFSHAPVLYCAGCGLGYVPDFAETLDNYYKRDYAESNRKDRGHDPEQYFSEAYQEKFPAVGRYFRRAQRQGRMLRAHGASFNTVLDFGSGPGYFLYRSQARNKFAFEPDEESRKYLDWMGATTLSTLADIKPASFDAICASHSIEHLVGEHLIDTLALLIRSLRRGGLFLIEVPQGGHSYLHLAGARQDPHTLFFTPQALSEAVRRAGGEIVLQDALSKVEIPRRADPLYLPPDDPFFAANRGSLTVICKAAAQV